MFIRGSPSEFYTIHRIAGDRRTFQEVVVSASLLNLLQLATLGGHYELVKYLLLEHKILSNTKQTKAMDPRIILQNTDNEEDET